MLSAWARDSKAALLGPGAVPFTGRTRYSSCPGSQLPAHFSRPFSCDWQESHGWTSEGGAMCAYQSNAFQEVTVPPHPPSAVRPKRCQTYLLVFKSVVNYVWCPRRYLLGKWCFAKLYPYILTELINSFKCVCVLHLFMFVHVFIY